MRCFYHEDKEAVGTCKSCGRGVCRECAVELSKGLACSGRCEADAQAVIRLIDQNIQLSSSSGRLVQTNRGFRYGIGVFQIVFGMLFLTWGFLVTYMRFAVFLGIVFVAYGLYTIYVVRKIGKITKAEN